MDLISSLLLILAVTILFGFISDRFNVSDVPGALVAGLLLGPVGLGLITFNSSLAAISDISVFFIILLIGVQITSDLFLENARKASVFTATSFLIPVALMTFVSIYFFHLNQVQSLMVSISIGVPSISIVSVIVLKNKLHLTADGKTLLFSVVISDLISILTVGFLGRSGISGVYYVIYILLFFVLIFSIDHLLKRYSRYISRIVRYVTSQEKGEDAAIFLVIILGLLVSEIFQVIGVSFILGAFFAGMLISKDLVGEEFYGILIRTIRRFNNSFFVPLFFAIAAIEATRPASGLVGLVLTLVVISALVGGGLDLFASKKFNTRIKHKTSVGVLGLRGSVGVIVATVALDKNILTEQLYSIVLIGIVILSVVMSVLVQEKIEPAALQQE
ncbi:MAG: cation:proton antiporter [Thermoplasmataceae archaeon]|jgi:Kef-type K+ transport system membrane component KefB